MAASVGYQGSFAGDASKPFVFRLKEWTRVLTKQEKKNKVKPIVYEEDFEIMPEKKVLKRVVNFASVNEGNNLTPHEHKIRQVNSANRPNDKKKKNKKQKEISNAAFEKVLEQVKRNDKNLKHVNKTIAVTIKILEEQLTKGIKITKLRRELHETIKNFEVQRLKTTIPLRKTDFERDFKEISENVDEIGEMYTKLTFKCSDWKEKFKKHNMDYYNLTNQKDTIPGFLESIYVDPYGFADFTPPDASNNYYDCFPVRLRKPSSHTKCIFLGHCRRCPSPKKRTHKANSIESFHRYGLHAKLRGDEQKPKTKPVSHGHEYKTYDEDFHRAARTCSE